MVQHGLTWVAVDACRDKGNDGDVVEAEMIKSSKRYTVLCVECLELNVVAYSVVSWLNRKT